MKLVLTPNPNKGIFFLHNSSSEFIEGNITVTSITGEIVYTKNNISIEGNKSQYFNLAQLPNNTYILHYYNTNFSIRKKIVIIN